MNHTLQHKLEESFGSEVWSSIQALLDKKLLIIGCVLATTLLAVVYILKAPKIYRAEAVVRVEQKEQKITKFVDVQEGDLQALEIPKTIEQSFTSPELLMQLVDHNNLRDDPNFLPELKRPFTDAQILDVLSKRITSKIRFGTRLIDVKVEDQSPAMAQNICVLLLKEYTEADFNRHMVVSTFANDYLLQQAERLQEKLTKAELALQKLKQKNQGFSLEDRQKILIDRLSQLNRLLTDAKGTRLKLESDYSQIKKLGKNQPSVLITIPGIATAVGVGELDHTIREKQAQLAEVSKLYGERHPSYQALDTELQDLKTALNQKVFQEADVVAKAYESATTTEQKMEEELRKAEQESQELNSISIPYNAALREEQTDKALYESVLTRLKETDVNKGAAPEEIRVLSHSIQPEKPVWPAKGRILVLSAFLGFAIGCALAFLSRILDGSLKTVDDAEHHLGIPALGAIPKGSKAKSKKEILVLAKQPGSPAAESFRSLRASLSLLTRQGTRKKNTACESFLFTSSVPTEGKSFCTANCATGFAQQGHRTLLIDADLRVPTIGKLFFGIRPVSGLAEVLRQERTLEEAIRPTEIENLFVLCAGIRRDSQAELLGGEGFGQVMKAALVAGQFDRVVIDSAPIDPVSDTLLIAGHVQAVCLVISAGMATTKIIIRSARKLAEARSAPVGFILNRVPASPRKYMTYVTASANGHDGNLRFKLGKLATAARSKLAKNRE
jgi:succinoglycan biosynthesis transport protein ExoP